MKRISEGDSLAKVYKYLGTPLVEYPLDGILVQEYELCTVLSCDEVVLSVECKAGVTVIDEPTEAEEQSAPTVQDIQAKAEQGDAEAQYTLAYCFQCGQVVAKDSRKAISWYTKAAMQGHAAAQHNLGYMYMKGDGVERDHEKAYIWALLAASNGDNTLEQSLAYRLSDEQKQAMKLRAKQMMARMDAKQAGVKH